MRSLVHQDYASVVVRQTAAMIASGTGVDSDYQIELIRRWLKAHVGFLRDPIGHELLHTPALMVTTVQQAGALDVDCDDVAMLGAALGMAIGLRARFVMIGRDGGYEHIWAELAAPMTEAWDDLDITRPFQANLSGYDLALAVEV